MDQGRQGGSLRLLGHLPIADPLELFVGDALGDLGHRVQVRCCNRASTTARSVQTSSASRSPRWAGGKKWSVKRRSLSTSMSRSGSRIVRICLVSHFLNSPSRVWAAASNVSAASVDRCQPSSSAVA